MLLAVFITLCFPFTSKADNTDSAPINYRLRLGNQNFNETNITGTFLIDSGNPKYESALVKYSPDGGFVEFSQDDFAHAVWTPYDGKIHLQLGPNDGVYHVMVSLKSSNPNIRPGWTGTLVTLRQKKPTIVITSLTNDVVSQPYLQLKGYSPLPLDNIRYDLSNATEVITNETGNIYDHYLDFNTSQYTTDFFQCYDIHLAEGQNSITLRATDSAGNTVTTNLNITLDYSHAMIPAIKVDWPSNGMEVCGRSFTMHGQVEDSAARVIATITDTNGNSNSRSGIVERTGRFWVENMPLRDGTNHIVVQVTNSAGLESRTNLDIVYSSFVLHMDAAKGDLWLPTTTITGYESDGTYPVWVNGVKAVVSINADGSGRWIAQNVPVTPGGVADFDMYAYKPDEIQPDGYYGNGKPAPRNIAGANSPKSMKLVSQNTTTPPKAPMVAISIQPIVISLAESNATLFFNWNTISNQIYQLQYNTELATNNWKNLGQSITAVSNSISTTDVINHGDHRFYRVFMLP